MKRKVKIDDATIDSKDPMAVIEPLWLNMDLCVSKEEYERALKPFSDEQKAVFAIMWFISEVWNGGFYQFYTNPTGIVWEDAMNGFDVIGISEAQKIINESAKRFNPSPSFDRNVRENYLDATDIEFEDLDDLIYTLDKKINLTQQVAEFICSNREAFYFEGEVED